MIEKGLLDGMCHVSHKEAKNQQHVYRSKLVNKYDTERSSSYINCLDAKHLYGLAMSMKLPIEQLKWIKKILTDKILIGWNEKDDKAHIVEVDLEYPGEIQHKLTQ